MVSKIKFKKYLLLNPGVNVTKLFSSLPILRENMVVGVPGKLRINIIFASTTGANQSDTTLGVAAPSLAHKY
jgi:hypothetical protein